MAPDKLYFQVGHILKIEVNIPQRPVKVCVCVSITPNLNFFINSANRTGSDSIKFRANYEKRDYPYKDSYLSLSNAFDHAGKTILKDYGPIEKDECEAILEKVQISQTLTQIEIEKIVEALNNFLEQFNDS